MSYAPSLVINDQNYTQFLGDDPYNCGGEKRLMTLKPRDWNSKPYGSVGHFRAEDKVTRIPEKEWDGIISQQEKDKSTPYDIWEQSKIGALDQDGYGWCHAFSCTDAIMLQREMQGLPYEELSPSSIAGPVTGWRNEGAMIMDDLEQGVKGGACSSKFAPMCDKNRSLFKDGWETDALNHRIVEFWEGKPNDFELMGSAILAGFCVCIGLDWWGHAITVLRIKLGKHDSTILNSWTPDWGVKGCGDLSGSKKIPNEWYVIRATTDYRLAI